MARSSHAFADRRLRRLARRLPLVAALVGVAALLPASSLGAKAIAIKDPNGIACPKPPAGWTNPSDGKSILNPMTDSMVPGNTVNVSCDYFTQSGKHLLVDLLYALPTDPNPHYDFYYGCTSAGGSWSEQERVFRVTSSNQWATAAFYDALRQIKAADVAAFQKVARQLLANGEGYGHGCSLKVQETTTQSHLQFSFEVAAGSAAGAFVTEGVASASSLPVVTVGVPDIPLSLMAHGKRYALTIHVEKGLTFVPGKGKNGQLMSKAQVKFAVVVTSSKLPSCPRGSTGTLAVSTAPSVLLKVCSQSFLQGAAKASIVAYG